MACIADPYLLIKSVGIQLVSFPLITDWKYSSGFVNANMMKEHLPPASNDVLIVMCGPPPMIQHACLPNLSTLGYKTENTFTY